MTEDTKPIPSADVFFDQCECYFELADGTVEDAIEVLSQQPELRQAACPVRRNVRAAPTC